MRLFVRHRTVHHYDVPARGTVQLWRLTPRNGPGQSVLRWSARDERGRTPPSYVDGFGNVTHLYTRREPCAKLEVEVEGVIETQNVGGRSARADVGPAPEVFLRSTPLTEPHPALTALAAEAGPSEEGVACLLRLCAAIQAALPHRAGVTDVETSAAAALLGGAGVCQDRAHVFIATARVLGFPARYVSGYLLPDGAADSLATHAWAEAWQRELGWIAFDPSQGICPDERFVRVAVAPDYRGAAPVEGVRIGGDGERLETALQVQEHSAQ